jgi:hypothetical protein
VAISGIDIAEREAVVRLVVLGPEDSGTSSEVEAGVDTSFSGHLMLPPKVVPSSENSAWFWLIGMSYPSHNFQPQGAKVNDIILISLRIGSAM